MIAFPCGCKAKVLIYNNVNVPLPLECLEEMKLLTDKDFGRLVRALLFYARVMSKDSPSPKMEYVPVTEGENRVAAGREL